MRMLPARVPGRGLRRSFGKRRSGTRQMLHARASGRAIHRLNWSGFPAYSTYQNSLVSLRAEGGYNAINLVFENLVRMLKLPTCFPHIFLNAAPVVALSALFAGFKRAKPWTEAY